MSKCPKCGAEAGNAKFCPECGNKMQAQNVCPSCGAQTGSAKFCPECGQKIEQVVTDIPAMPDFDINLGDLHSLSQSMLENKQQTQSRSAEYDQAIVRARATCIRGLFDEAKILYEQMLDADPVDMNAYMGFIRIASKNYTEYNKDAESAVRIAMDICGNPDLSTYDKDYIRLTVLQKRAAENQRRQAEADKEAEEERKRQHQLDLEEKNRQDTERRKAGTLEEEKALEQKKKDIAQALKWYAEKKNYAKLFPILLDALDTPLVTPEIKRAVGYCYSERKGTKRNIKEAVRLYAEAAEEGDVMAKNNLGVCYHAGDGVPQDYKMAAKLYTEAAEAGNKLAQCNLGACYAEGKGVTKNLSTAVKWYKKSALQGHPTAMRNLAECYRDGKGVTRNLSEALNWCKKAEDVDNNSAYTMFFKRDILKEMNDLGYQCYEGNSVPKSPSLAYFWWKEAAEAGYAMAQYNLGWCYKTGYHVAQNLADAKKWYQKAAAQGNQNAIDALKNM